MRLSFKEYITELADNARFPGMLAHYPNPDNLESRVGISHQVRNLFNIFRFRIDAHLYKELS